MKRFGLLSVLIAFVGILSAMTDREVTADSNPVDDAQIPNPEPTNAKPSSESAKPFNPLTLHEPGRAAAQWGYDDMSPEEQAVLDRGFDTSNWGEAQKIHAAAAFERYPAIAAQRAQLMLGVTDLAGAGVVP